MNKDELKQYLHNMQLEEDFEALLFQLVDEAQEVDQALLNKVADVLDAQAEFYEESADLLDEQAEIFETLDDTLKLIDEEEDADRAEALLENQQTLLTELSQKINESSSQQAETNQMDQIKQELTQHITQSETPGSSTTPPQE
jgi:chromosome condensin MukBEF ATPase and DNA-binding subunit MukB